MNGPTAPQIMRVLIRPERLSFVLMAVMLLLIGWLHMATLMLTALFCFLALRGLSFGGNKIVGLALFTVLFIIAGGGLYFFTKQAYVAVPKILETTIPAITSFAEQNDMHLPFTDVASLKKLLLDGLKDTYDDIGHFARGAVFQIAYLIIGLVVAVSLFLNSQFRVEGDPHTSDENLYTLTGNELQQRFRTFFHSFATVMGAQILISAANTAATAVFLVLAGFPHVTVLVMFTFLCGLLPIIGNLISNTVITGVGFSISPQMAGIALLFLVGIHKLEYFLNSQIIGSRIKNPMWLTLLGLVIGEKLMGIPGMILAPVILHYIKVEASRARVAKEAPAESP